MSQENVEVVKRGFEHLAATGEPLWASIAADVEVHDHHSPDQDVYEGHVGLGRWLEDWDAAWGEWSIELDRVVDAGDSVVAIYRMRVKGKGSGLELDLLEAQVWQLRSGSAVRLDVYGSIAEALETVGVSE